MWLLWFPLRIKHINVDEKSVTQNPREVATKFGNNIDTFFAKGFEEAEAVLRKWLAQLDEIELYGPDDPLFPATSLVTKSNTGFVVKGFERRHWQSTGPVRKIVRTAFERIGQPNYGPHAFRHMLARHAVQTSTSVAQARAQFAKPGSFGCVDHTSHLRPDQPRTTAGISHRKDGR